MFRCSRPAFVDIRPKSGQLSCDVSRNTNRTRSLLPMPCARAQRRLVAVTSRGLAMESRFRYPTLVDVPRPGSRGVIMMCEFPGREAAATYVLRTWFVSAETKHVKCQPTPRKDLDSSLKRSTRENSSAGKLGQVRQTIHPRRAVDRVPRPRESFI